MQASFKLTALSLGLLFAANAWAATDLTVVSFGGANKAAQVKAFYAPWEAKGEGKIIAGEYNGEMAKIKAMVDTKSISWDLVEVESPELSRGCDEDMFEALDPALFGNPEQYVKGAIQTCGAGFFVWSTVLAYNADKLKTAPTSWVDFWDTKTFPGKRGLRQGAKYTLEFALMAESFFEAIQGTVDCPHEGNDLGRQAVRRQAQIRAQRADRGGRVIGHQPLHDATPGAQPGA